MSSPEQRKAEIERGERKTMDAQNIRGPHDYPITLTERMKLSEE